MLKEKKKEMVNKAPLAVFPKEPGNAFPFSAILNLVTLNASLLPCSYSCPFILGLFRRSGAGAGTICVDLGPSLTSELSTEGRASVSGVG